MILGYSHIVKAINEIQLMENVDPNNINAASVDCTLAPVAFIESPYHFDNIDLASKENIATDEISLHPHFDLDPAGIVIVSTQERFNLSDNIAAEFRLKSSAARNGLTMCLGLHCDPGWHGSVLTFTLVNQCRRSTLRLRAGMKIGQAIFRRVDGEVPEEKSYATRGQYNNDEKAQVSKGIR